MKVPKHYSPTKVTNLGSIQELAKDHYLQWIQMKPSALPYTKLDHYGRIVLTDKDPAFIHNTVNSLPPKKSKIS